MGGSVVVQKRGVVPETILPALPLAARVFRVDDLLKNNKKYLTNDKFSGKLMGKGWLKWNKLLYRSWPGCCG